jgi:ASCH domain
MLRALSIRQPWAWAVAAGHKRVENRTWSTSYRGPLAIHAARVLERHASATVARLAGEPVPEGLALGAVIAVAHLIEVVQSFDDPWFVGPYGFVLANVRPIAPVLCIGQQRFFDLPHDVEGRVRHQIRHRAVA